MFIKTYSHKRIKFILLIKSEIKMKNETIRLFFYRANNSFEFVRMFSHFSRQNKYAICVKIRDQKIKTFSFLQRSHRFRKKCSRQLDSRCIVYHAESRESSVVRVTQFLLYNQIRRKIDSFLFVFFFFVYIIYPFIRLISYIFFTPKTNGQKKDVHIYLKKRKREREISRSSVTRYLG